MFWYTLEASLWDASDGHLNKCFLWDKKAGNLDMPSYLGLFLHWDFFFTEYAEFNQRYKLPISARSNLVSIWVNIDVLEYDKIFQETALSQLVFFELSMVN